jgi:hypothetical protein
VGFVKGFFNFFFRFALRACGRRLPSATCAPLPLTLIIIAGFLEKARWQNAQDFVLKFDGRPGAGKSWIFIQPFPFQRVSSVPTANTLDRALGQVSCAVRSTQARFLLQCLHRLDLGEPH